MYFSLIPDLIYPDLQDKTKRVIAKNFFRKVRMREDLSTAPLFFATYTIEDGETPDIVADKLYSNASYFWILLIVNNITNLNKEWPVSSYNLGELLSEKYDNPYAIKHYETIDLYDDEGNQIQEKGIIVPQNYKLRYYNSTTDLVETLSGEQIMMPVSYTDYETNINNEKREIFYLKRRYISKFIDEFKSKIAYETDYGVDKLGRKLPNV